MDGCMNGGSKVGHGTTARLNRARIVWGNMSVESLYFELENRRRSGEDHSLENSMQTDGLLNGISPLSFLESFPRMNNFFVKIRHSRLSNLPRNLSSSSFLILSTKRIITNS